jgi:hypothetical protein
MAKRYELVADSLLPNVALSRNPRVPELVAFISRGAPLRLRRSALGTPMT